MDFYSLGFIFVIVMVSGVIAYLADIYGRKLGKKRLSLFGMRPRHTAAVSTVLLGMSLSILTIGLGLLFSSPVRRWILEGSSALRQLNVLQNQLKIEELKVKVAQQQAKATQDLAKGLSTKIAQNQLTLGTQTNEIKSEQTTIASLQTDQTRLQTDLSTTRLSLNDKSRKIHIDQIKIDETDIKLKRNEGDLQTVQKELDQSSKRAKDARQANTVLLDDNEKLLANIRGQKTELASLQDQRRQLEKSASELKADLKTKGDDLQELNSQLQDETQKLSRILGQYGDLNLFATMNNQITRTSPMIYHYLQEVCRLPVAANLTSQEADQAIDALLRKAQTEAERRGAKAHGTAKVADIIARTGITPEEYRDQIKQKLVGKPNDMVLIALSSINAFLNEPVSLDIVPEGNPTVYKRGEKIGECDLDGNGTDLLIVKQLKAFGAKLTERARSDQMIPQADDGSFGFELPADQVLNLVDEVKQTGRRVRLQAMVAMDTHAADPLKLNFRIR